MSIKFLTKNTQSKQKLYRFGLMIGSILGSAAINYTVLHNPLVFVFIMSLFIHELGHYIVAKKHKADPDFPYFIPLFPFTIGVTRIKNLKDKYKSSVASAGTLFSSFFFIILFLFNYYYNLFSPLYILIMFIAELIFNYFGSDGKKYRQYKPLSL